jgi:hypothetical protein
MARKHKTNLSEKIESEAGYSGDVSLPAAGETPLSQNIQAEAAYFEQQQPQLPFPEADEGYRGAGAEDQPGYMPSIPAGIVPQTAAEKRRMGQIAQRLHLTEKATEKSIARKRAKGQAVSPESRLGKAYQQSHGGTLPPESTAPIAGIPHEAELIQPGGGESSQTGSLLMMMARQLEETLQIVRDIKDNPVGAVFQ